MVFSFVLEVHRRLVGVEILRVWMDLFFIVFCVFVYFLFIFCSFRFSCFCILAWWALRPFELKLISILLSVPSCVSFVFFFLLFFLSSSLFRFASFLLRSFELVLFGCVYVLIFTGSFSRCFLFSLFFSLSFISVYIFVLLVYVWVYTFGPGVCQLGLDLSSSFRCYSIGRTQIPRVWSYLPVYNTHGRRFKPRR